MEIMTTPLQALDAGRLAPSCVPAVAVPPRGPALTVLVSCINVCSKIQEALKAGQAFGFLAGQI